MLTTIVYIQKGSEHWSYVYSRRNCGVGYVDNNSITHKPYYSFRCNSSCCMLTFSLTFITTHLMINITSC